MIRATATIPIRDIEIGDRHRKDFGDLNALATSIEQQGLLQPIGITADNRLVFGERRLRAVRDILGWDSIDTRVVEVDSIVAGEFAENEIRKDFTPSERVAIGRAIEAEIGERRGRPAPEENVDSGPQLPKGEKARDHVAKAVGFGSGKQYDRAKKVDAKGSPKLKEAVDHGEIDVTNASKLVDLPHEQQDEIVGKGTTAAKRAARNGKPKRYPVSDHIGRWASNLTGLSQVIVEDYGGLDEMVRLDGWNRNETKSILGHVRALADFTRRFQEVLENHVNDS